MTNANMWKYRSIALIAILAATSLYVVPQQFSLVVPTAYASGALTNVRVSNTNNLIDTSSWYVVSFRTASTGTIAFVEMTFPSGFDVSQVRLIQSSGIGAGTMSFSAQSAIYTVTSPVSIPSNTQIKIMMERIVNPNIATVSNQVAVTTLDGSSTAIDGPTNSANFALASVGTNMIADGAVTDTKIASGAVSLLNAEYTEIGAVPGLSSNFVTSNCPSGFIPVGGGYAITGALTVLSSSRSGLGTGGGWTVSASNSSPSEQTLIVYAECVKVLP